MCFCVLNQADSCFQLTGTDFLFVFDEVNPSFLCFPPTGYFSIITWDRERKRERRIDVSCVVAAPFSILTAGWLARFTFLDLIRAVSVFVSVSASFYLLGEPNCSGVNILSLWIRKETIFSHLGFIWELFCCFFFCVCADLQTFWEGIYWLTIKEVIMGCCIFNPSNILYVQICIKIRLIFQAFIRKGRVSFDFIHTENYPMYAQ